MIMETMPVWKWKAWYYLCAFFKVSVDKLPDEATMCYLSQAKSLAIICEDKIVSKLLEPNAQTWTKEVYT